MTHIYSFVLLLKCEDVVLLLPQLYIHLSKFLWLFIQWHFWILVLNILVSVGHAEGNAPLFSLMVKTGITQSTGMDRQYSQVMETVRVSRTHLNCLVKADLLKQWIIVVYFKALQLLHKIILLHSDTLQQGWAN